MVLCTNLVCIYTWPYCWQRDAVQNYNPSGKAVFYSVSYLYKHLPARGNIFIYA